MSRSSPVLHADGFAPLEATIVPIGSDGMSDFWSERDPEVPLVLADRATSSSPSNSSTSSTAKGRHPLIWVGIFVAATAGGVVSGLAMAALGAAAAPLPSTGAVTITSDPPGAPVAIDGEARGSTPLAIAVMAGSHRVEVGSGADVRPWALQVTPGGAVAVHVQRQVEPEPSSPAPQLPSLQAGQASPVVVERAPSVASAGVAIVATPALTIPRKDQPKPLDTVRTVPTGWLTVTSPFPVQVLDNGTEIGTSASARIALPAGDRPLVLVNAALEFREERQVKIVAGRKTALAIEGPQGTLHVNARPWAVVWIDGRRVGETPIGNIALPIGEHEVVFRHPNHADQRKTVTVGAGSAARVTVEFQP